MRHGLSSTVELWKAMLMPENANARGEKSNVLERAKTKPYARSLSILGTRDRPRVSFVIRSKLIMFSSLFGPFDLWSTPSERAKGGLKQSLHALNMSENLLSPVLALGVALAPA